MAHGGRRLLHQAAAVDARKSPMSSSRRARRYCRRSRSRWPRNLPCPRCGRSIHHPTPASKSKRTSPRTRQRCGSRMRPSSCAWRASSHGSSRLAAAGSSPISPPKSARGRPRCASTARVPTRRARRCTSMSSRASRRPGFSTSMPGTSCERRAEDARPAALADFEAWRRPNLPAHVARTGAHVNFSAVRSLPPATPP